MVICLFVYVYLLGAFHPKYFILNGIRINAPMKTYLYSVLIDNDTIFDLFSPLKFSNISKYTLAQNQYAKILFFNSINNNLLDITAKKSTPYYFKTYISKINTKKILTPLLETYDYCDTAYQYKNENIKVFLLFNNYKNIQFSLSSDDENILLHTVKEICKK